MVYPPCKDIRYFDSRASTELVSEPLLAPFCHTIAFLKYIRDTFLTEASRLDFLHRELTSGIVLQQSKALLYMDLLTDVWAWAFSTFCKASRRREHCGGCTGQDAETLFAILRCVRYQYMRKRDTLDISHPATQYLLCVVRCLRMLLVRRTNPIWWKGLYYRIFNGQLAVWKTLWK